MNGTRITEERLEDKVFLREDRMRYIKNTTSSRLALLAILFNVLFFVSIYKSDVGSYYYTILIGASILYNLVFMLLVFLCSEGVKQYKKNYSLLLALLGIGQIVRIFIIPMNAHTTEITVKKVTSIVMGDAQFIRTVIYLAVSGACCLAGAAINLKKSMTLKAHIASLGGQSK